MSKLVRDKIPEIIKQAGKIPVIRKASQVELFPRLLEKLKEETNEVCNAKDDYEIIQELADVYEVIISLSELVNCSIEDVVAIAQAKRTTRGAFCRGIILEDIKEKDVE